MVELGVSRADLSVILNLCNGADRQGTLAPVYLEAVRRVQQVITAVLAATPTESFMLLPTDPARGFDQREWDERVDAIRRKFPRD